MPKIINQTGVSIDSLQAKLTLLENQHNILNSKYDFVLDSLKSVNQTALKSEVVTSFYTTHLAYYTAYTALIVTLIAALFSIFNWAAFYRPIKKSVKKNIAKFRTELDEFKNKEFSSLIKDINSTSSIAYRTIAITYADSMPGISFIFALKILKLLDAMEVAHSKEGKWRQDQIVLWINYCLNFLKKDNFKFPTENETTKETIQILLDLSVKDEHKENRDSFLRIINLFKSKTEKQEQNKETKAATS